MRYSEIVEVVNKVMEEYEIRLTIRQLYYRVISPPYQLFANTLNNYKAFDKIMTRARERGEVDWTRIEDRARATMGGDFGWDSPDEFLNEMLDSLKTCDENFTRRMWDNQPQYVEVWVEKDALASLFHDAIRGFRVVTFPSRGYSSFTKIMEAMTERFVRYLKRGQPIVVLHFSDHDPSGLDMTNDLVERFRKYFSMAVYGAEAKTESDIADTIMKMPKCISLKRIALTDEQVKQFNLAPNPTKVADPRSRDYMAKYGNQCWELDAYPPDKLQSLVKQAVSTEIDSTKWKETRETIEKEQQYLKEKLSKMRITFES